MASDPSTMPSGDIADVDRIVEAIGRRREHVVPILRAIQERWHYLPEAALRRVCETTAITPAAVTGVATFYPQFRLRPAGRHLIRVCVGTACHVKGGERVYEAFRQHLRIPADEDTDPDRLFTVDKVACLGCCMLAPVVQIDEMTYGPVEPMRVNEVIRDFLAGQGADRDSAPTGSGAATPEGEARICLCSSCRAAGAAEVRDEIERWTARRAGRLRVKEVGCTGVSFQVPLVDVQPAGGPAFRYGRVRPADVGAILSRHLRPRGALGRAGAVAGRWFDRLLTDETWEPVTRYALDMRSGPDAPYVSAQKHLVLEHAGALDPLDLDEYLQHGGFEGLRRCLAEASPEWVIEQVEESGLKGRGGAGFPAAVKWITVRHARDALKYVVANGDEGDPGAFMDRMIMESFPFRVLEGMAIAAYAVGAAQGFVYVRSEYPLATRRLDEAIRLCEARGLIGERMLGSGPPLRVSVKEGAGAFVCGEETALIAAIEGERGMPRFRPPYPAEHGLWGHPTLVNNVETLAFVPWIIRHGPEAFLKLGTHGSRGTKTFALAGKVKRGGLIEVPMGMTLREIVETIGGGVEEGHTLKAVQIGGPSGGCISASLADTPVDYEALISAGAIMGSGGLVVLDERDCMVDIARYFLTFAQRESCGKCTHCRVGTKRMLELLDRLCEGQGKAGDLDALEQLSAITHRGSLCGLGKTAPNPALSTLRHFRAEYEAHLAGRCPAGRCRALIRYQITDACIGCTRCAQHCPADAIEPRPYRQHEIDQTKCTKCDTCRQVCPSGAVKVG